MHVYMASIFCIIRGFFFLFFEVAFVQSQRQQHIDIHQPWNLKTVPPPNSKSYFVQKLQNARFATLVIEMKINVKV